MNEINVGKWDALRMEAYKGRISLLALKNVKGKYDNEWCKVQLSTGEMSEKFWPMKVKLGDSTEEAIATLEKLLAQLKDDAPF